ncbi:MAG TPA: hypothetical protein VFP84_08590 [Kofleriaceae bacterium]|nr:hypothetical protein [Kofleriaceae bacterium]
MLSRGRADAYPQYQLMKDQTCTNCHISPAGGGLLTENGYSVAEAFSEFGTAPEFMYGAIPLPDWLQIGGDFRSAYGLDHTPDNLVGPIPMQGDIYLHAAYKNLSLQVTVGARPPQYITMNGTPGPLDYFWSREHYLTWQQNDGGSDGLYVRVGRFMPVFGLRYVEHVDYTRRFGGVPLYAETYAAAVEYIKPDWEAHVTGFIDDPLIDQPTRGNGAAAYVEVRPHKNYSVGGEAMLNVRDGLATPRVGVTGKYLVDPIGLALQAEVQYVHIGVDGPKAPNQIVAYLLASQQLGRAFLLDVGLGHFDENVAIQGLDRDALDVNFHWFTTSHLELVLQNRIEGLGIGSANGGPTGGYVLLHAHYRL